MTEIEQLRGAIEKTSWPAIAHDETYIHESRTLIPNDIYQSRIRDAALRLLKLHEDHPELQGLIDGTHEIVEISETASELRIARRLRKASEK